jgi:hypothetical protein
LAPQCVIRNDYQLRLPIALAASRRRTGTVTAVHTAFAGACLALALTGIAATAAVTLGAASVVDADRCSTERDDGKGRPEEQTFHRKSPYRRELNSETPCRNTRHWQAHLLPRAIRQEGGRRLIQFRQTPYKMRGGRCGMVSPAARANRANSADDSADPSETCTTAKWSGR